MWIGFFRSARTFSSIFARRSRLATTSGGGVLSMPLRVAYSLAQSSSSVKCGVSSLEEGKGSGFYALSRRRAGRRRRIGERGMRREARAAVGRRVVDLEHDRLVARELRKVEPAVRRVELQAIGLADAVRVAPLGDQQVARRDAARVGERQRIGADRLV